MSSRACTFRFAIILFIVAMTGMLSGSGQTVIVVSRPLLDDLNNRGTLLFGSRQQQDELEEGEVDRPWFLRDQVSGGALTMERPQDHSHSLRRVNANAVAPVRFGEIEFVPMSVPHSSPRSFPSKFPTQQYEGVTAMQIAFGSEEGFSPQDITPVSEVGTWLFAPLGLLVIAYSQRRRLAYLVRRALFKNVLNRPTKNREFVAVIS